MRGVKDEGCLLDHLAIDQSWARLHHRSCNFVASPGEEDCGCQMPSFWQTISPHLSPSPGVFPLSAGSMYFSKSPSSVPSLSLHWNDSCTVA